MKRPIRIWTTVVATVLTAALGAIPAHAATTTTAENDPAATATETDPVDPPLYDATAGGDTIRVNVVTETRDDLSSAASTGRTLQTFQTLPIVTLRVDRAGLDELAAQDGVISVTEDVPAAPTLDESIPVIGADHAIKAGKTGKGSTIAIIDTGVATNHPFLKGRVVTEACYSPIDTAYGATSLCPNGTPQQEGTGAANSATGACATLDGCDHGTHVAGIAAGNGTGLNGAPATGVAPEADIIAIQVFSKLDSTKYCTNGTNPCIRSFTSAQIAALEKIWQLRQAGTPVIAANLSLGSASYTSACTKDARKTAIDKLLEAGVATVVAAGNNGLPTAVNAPACVPSALTIGSTTDDDEISSFSNHGPLLDLLAPGTGIVSSVLSGYDAKSGTSMAAPHVTGALATLRQTYPTENITSLTSLLATTGTPITDEAGTTTPRINLAQAVGATQPEPEPAAKPRPSTIVNDTDYAVPDPGTVESPIKVSGIPGNAPGALQVGVALTHEWLAEVQIDLVDPNGKTYALKPTSETETGGTLGKTYTVDAGASPAEGTWRLLVQDKSAGAEGTLDSWSLTFPSHENQAGHAIPDAGVVESPITVGGGFTGNAPKALPVYVAATHEWLGDLELSLVAPDGKTYPLKSASETEAGGTLRKLYTVDAGASPMVGTWKLRAQDTSEGATGTLTGWSLTLPTAYENQTAHTVPDPGTADSPITVSGITGNAPRTLRVYVDATHEWLGDLELSLVAPDGKTYPLKSTSETETGGTLRKLYTVDAGASPMVGTWKLRAQDTSEGA
ncbi:proprotein convertase P-domain-containing protein, partial [Streptomyces sp. NPDC052020]|uniref:proprotein convertase P-domain-containing protein n=1 Tax=Streptomyces sp. NPDC052020 TaxID=3155677 RepID=UPI0034271057